MNNPSYPLVFVLSVVIFVFSILMAFFTYEILTQELEAIEYN